MFHVEDGQWGDVCVPQRLWLREATSLNQAVKVLPRLFPPQSTCSASFSCLICTICTYLSANNFLSCIPKTTPHQNLPWSPTKLDSWSPCLSDWLPPPHTCTYDKFGNTCSFWNSLISSLNTPLPFEMSFHSFLQAATQSYALGARPGTWAAQPSPSPCLSHRTDWKLLLGRGLEKTGHQQLPHGRKKEEGWTSRLKQHSTLQLSAEVTLPLV